MEDPSRNKCDSYKLLPVDNVFSTQHWWYGQMLYDGKLVRYWCPCGCGIEAVLNVRTDDDPAMQGRLIWKLLFDGDLLPTLTPSIVASGFACKSHYFIENGKVRWA